MALHSGAYGVGRKVRVMVLDLKQLGSIPRPASKLKGSASRKGCTEVGRV